VYYYLPLVLAKLRLQCFMETNRFCCNHVHEGTPLHARKHHCVNLLRMLCGAHHYPAARTTQTFVRRGGDEMCIRNGTWMLVAGHQPSHVCHIDKEKRAHRVRDLAQLFVIE